MANIYVRSTDGSDSDNGSTWALAKATLTGAAAIDAAGDTIYVSQAHSETTATALVFSFAGTVVSPTKIICANDGAAPPTATANTGVVATTVASSHTFNGCLYVNGLTFTVGSSTSAAQFLTANTDGDVQVFDGCAINLNSTSGSSLIAAATTISSSESMVEFRDCTIQFSHASHRIDLRDTFLKITGGSAVSDVNPGSFVFANASGACGCEIENFNFTNWGTAVNVFATTKGILRARVRNCKFATSWAGSLHTGTLIVGSRIEMHNCDAGDTNYKLWIEDYFGTVRDETTIVRTSGASDGTTPLAWKMTTTADADYPHQTLVGPEISIWNDTTGGAKTVEIEIVNDGTTLTDGQVWLSLDYMGTSGAPLGSRARSGAKATYLTTATSYTTSSTTWTTTGLTTPVKQKLSVTFTPVKKGWLLARVMLAEPSKTIYVDPKLTVT